MLGLGERERDYLLAWVGENLTLVRRSASGQRAFYWILGIGFVVGLAGHVGGFLLKSSATTEPLLLVADLIYALGWALSTGVVWWCSSRSGRRPKSVSTKQALDAYEPRWAIRPESEVARPRTRRARKTHDFSSLWPVCARVKP